MKKAGGKDLSIQVRVHPARKKILKQEKDLVGASMSQIVRHGISKKVGADTGGELRLDLYEDLINVAFTLNKQAGEVDDQRLDMDMINLKVDLNRKATRIEEIQKKRKKLREKAQKERRTRETSSRISFRIREPLDNALRDMALAKDISPTDLVRRGIAQQVDRKKQCNQAAHEIDQWISRAEWIQGGAEQGENPARVRKEMQKLAREIHETVYEEIMR